MEVSFATSELIPTKVAPARINLRPYLVGVSRVHTSRQGMVISLFGGLLSAVVPYPSESRGRPKSADKGSVSYFWAWLFDGATRLGGAMWGCLGIPHPGFRVLDIPCAEEHRTVGLCCQ